MLTIGLGFESDGLGVHVSDTEAVGTSRRLDPVLLGHATAAWAALRDRDLRGEELGAAEAEVFSLLLALLDGVPGLGERAARQRARAEARGEPMALGLELRSGPVADLPWELLEADPGGRSAVAPSQVFRLSPGPVPPPRQAVGVHVDTWLPEPDVPACRRAADALAEQLAGADGVSTRVLHGMAGLLDVPLLRDAGGPLHVLHVLVPAGRLPEVLETLAPTDPRAPTGALRLLSGVDAVLLDRCGDAGFDAIGAPRLARAGVPVVMQGGSLPGGDTGSAFAHGFYRALAAGRPTGDAVSAGRRAVAGTGEEAAASRWWAFRSWVRHPNALENATVPAPDLPPMWPRPSAAAARVLREAWRVAPYHGCLGVEALAHGLAWAPPDGWMDPALFTAAAPGLRDFASSAAPMSNHGQLRASPRVVALGTLLPTPFSPEALLRALVSVPRVADTLGAALVARVLQGSSGGVASTARPPARGPRSLVLEVESGPEEGRVLWLDTPGQHLGRWDPAAPADPATTLYRDMPWDPAMSRRHLRFHGSRTLEALRPASLRRAGRLSEVNGIFEVAPGDRLRLGSTWIRVW